MTSNSKRFVLLIALSACLLLSSCNQNSERTDFSITLRLRHVFNVNEESAQSIELVAKRIIEKTKGAETFALGLCITA